MGCFWTMCIDYDQSHITYTYIVVLSNPEVILVQERAALAGP